MSVVYSACQHNQNSIDWNVRVQYDDVKRIFQNLFLTKIHAASVLYHCRLLHNTIMYDFDSSLYRFYPNKIKWCAA